MTATRRVIAAVTAFGLAIAAGCGMGRGKPDGSGTIECTQVLVAPQVAGKIAKMPAREGMALRAGDLVAQIDTADYELRRVESEAALALVQAQLELVTAGSRDEDVQRAKAQVREAEAVSRAAEADRKRIEEVFEKGSATTKQRDDARAGAERSAAALDAAQQQLTRLTRGSRLEEVRMAQAQVDLAKARMAQAAKGLADCAVKAPIDGTVTTRIREEGEVVGVGTPLVSLSRLDEVWLTLFIPEPRVASVKVGQTAWVMVDGSDKRIEGKVTFVSPEAEFTPRNVQTREERAKLVFRVRVTVLNSDGILKPGMPADGFL
jgi:HlyD family secretion protein